MTIQLKYAGSLLTLENESTYGLVLAIDSLSLDINTEDADTIMYELSEDKHEGSIYKIYTEIDDTPSKFADVALQSTSYIKYDGETIIRFSRFADSTTRVRVIKNDGNSQYLWKRYLTKIEEA